VSSTALTLPDRAQVTAALKKHFFLRVHMFVILGGTISVALLTTKILLITHEHNLAMRYGIAVVVAFAAFLGFLKLWLGYVSHCAKSASGSDWSDVLDFDCDGFSSSSSGAADELTSGGGSFGGGGATGSWGEGQPVVAPAPSSGFTLPSIDVDEDLGVIILVAVLVLVIAFAALWVIWAAPAILGEAAFQASLTVALARRAKKISSGSWVGSVVKSTIIPFVVVLALAVTLGWYAQKKCPSAARLHDALRCSVTALR